MTIKADPMARGAKEPAPAFMTVHPIVKTRKNVPTNSTMYLFKTASFFRDILFRVFFGASTATNKAQTPSILNECQEPESAEQLTTGDW
jgi:hypothetical protein